MAARWAVYFAPPPGSVLEDLGNRWLGRDLQGRTAARPAVAGLSAERAAALTAAPRRYGFHATLKPPFVLADGRTEAGLAAAAEGFAAERQAFIAPALEVAAIGTFLALVPSAPSPGLDSLAADCVRAFEPWRAAASPEDLARRRQADLSARQEDLLQTWGYPIVLDEFRFHMTLTGPVPDPAERATVADALREFFGPVCASPLAVPGIALYAQPDRGTPFTLRQTLPFSRG